MSTELVQHLEFLIENELPFMALRQSDKTSVLVLSQQDNVLHYKPHDTLSHAVFSKFQNKGNQFFIHGDMIKDFSFISLKKTLVTPQNDLSVIAQEGYKALVENAINSLKSSPDFKKVVLSRKQTFNNHIAPQQLFEKLLHQYSSANSYFFYHPKVGKWMGATPEILVKLENDELTTMSLAGTALWVDGEHHTWGAKELEEQEFVTNHIIDALSQSGIADVIVKPLETVLAGSLIHLRTMITATVAYSDHAQIAAALHPTPAICGIPTSVALDFVIQNEGYDRSFYTGYLGVIHPQEKAASYFVNLRCMELLENEAVVYVGGGITAMSDAQLELDETIYKSHTMSSLLK